MTVLKDPRQEAERERVALVVAASLDDWFTEHVVFDACRDRGVNPQPLYGPMSGYLRKWYREGMLERGHACDIGKKTAGPNRESHPVKFWYRWIE